MKNTLTIARGFKALLLAGGATTIALATPAFAQDNQNDAPNGSADSSTADSSAPIVVTGSRIQRKDYQSNSPIVTVDEKLLQQSSTAAIEQNLNKLPQFTPAKTPTGGGDIQPTATNTPGAATISLRGLGANRNLVLIDGRRVVPSNAAGIVDINVIPSAAIERVEIISGGASATYGADAVAGVTNFILKKNFQGLELDGQYGVTEHGDNEEFQLSGIMGTDFADGRGNISIAMSWNKRNPSYQRDRDWYQDIWRDPTTGSGGRFFALNPGIALGFGNAPSSSAFFNQFPGANPVSQQITLKNGADPTLGTSYSCVNNYGANPIDSGLCNVVVTPGGPVNVLGGLQGFSIYANQDGSLFTTGYNQRGGVSGFNGQTQDGDLAITNSNGSLKFVDTSPYLILPLTRYNMFMRGNYEINDWIGVFAQGLYSNTKTLTKQQGGAITSGWDVFVPYGTGVYTGSANPSTAYGSVGLPSSVLLNGMNGYVDNTPTNLADNPTNPAFAAAYGSQYACALSATGGCTNNQVIGQYLPQNIQDVLNSRTDPNGRVELNYGFPDNRAVTNEVSAYDMLAGFEGSVPGTDWTWQAFVDHGATSTFTRQTGVFSLTRLRTLLMSPGFGQGFEANSNQASGRPAFGANFASCTSGMNIFALSWDQISQDCKNAITADLKNNSKVTQTIAEVDAQGKLFDLPAGELRAAIGASYRKLSYEFVNDTITNQGESFLDQAVGIYPSSDSFGSYTAKEAYGELLVPVLHDIPGIKHFDLELGGRYSDYDTTGSSWTYKILGDWQVTDWLRLRGGYNRAERSPNIAELFQSSSQIFGFNSLGDLCSQQSTYRISAGAASPIAADVKAVCSAVMDNTGGAGTGASYYGRPLTQQPAAGGGFAWTNATGNPNLKPEVADTWSAGVVLQSPFTSPALSRLRFTVDWYKIHLKDAIGLQGAGTALQQCLDPYWNPDVTGAAGSASQAQAAAANQYCSGIRYDPAPILGAANFDVTYYNAGEVDISGIDAQLDYSVNIGPGTFSLNSLLNYYLHYKSRELADNPLVDYAGTLGTAQNGLNPGAYRYRVFTTFGYSIGGATLSLQWQHLPSVKQESAALFATPVNGYKAYDLFSLYGTYQVTDNVNLRAGVDNLFNKAPPIGGINTAVTDPTGSTLPGGAFNSQFYDTNGRRFYIGANVKF